MTQDSRKPRVFVVQDQHYFDKAAGAFRPKFDLQRAAAYGDVVCLVEPQAKPYYPRAIIDRLRDALQDYDATHDYLVMIGNPCIVAWACSIAAEVTGGPLRMLQWSSHNAEFIKIEADVRPRVQREFEGLTTRVRWVEERRPDGSTEETDLRWEWLNGSAGGAGIDSLRAALGLVAADGLMSDARALGTEEFCA